MSELEIHHDGGHDEDPLGKKIGVLAAVIAIFLSGVTILSHRSHTAAVVEKTEANNQWSYYQSKKVRLHNYELGKDMMELTAPKNEAAEAKIATYEKQIKHYEKEGEDIQEKAREHDKESKLQEERALRFDLGEGFLELGLVLTSLYFLSKKKIFPAVGIAGAILGILLGIAGLMTH